MVEVPNESRWAMQQFLAEQKAKEAQMGPRKENPKKQERERAKLRKPMRPQEFDKFVRKNGAFTEGGRGRHGVHVVSNGQERPVPRHRVLSTGVQKSLVNFVLS